MEELQGRSEWGVAKIAARCCYLLTRVVSTGARRVRDSHVRPLSHSRVDKITVVD